MPDDIPSLDYRVGQIDGRVTTMESRMDRHETEMRSRLVSIDGKLDSLLETRAERTAIVRAEIWIIGTGLTIIGIVAEWWHSIREWFGSHS